MGSVFAGIGLALILIHVAITDVKHIDLLLWTCLLLSLFAGGWWGWTFTRKA